MEAPETLLKQVKFLQEDVMQTPYPSLSERFTDDWFCEWLKSNDSTYDDAILKLLQSWFQNHGDVSASMKTAFSVMGISRSGCKGNDFLLRFLLYTSLQNTNEILTWLCHNEGVTSTTLKIFCEWERLCGCIWAKHSLNVTEDEVTEWCADHMNECSLVYNRLCIYEEMAAEEPFSIPSCFHDSSYDYQIITHHLTCRYEKQNQLAINLLQFYPIAVTYALYEKRVKAVISRNNDEGM